MNEYDAAALIPRSLRGKYGELRPIHPTAIEPLSCPVCRAPMERAEIGWGCPRVLGHCKIIPDATILSKIDRNLAKAKGRKPKAVSVLRHAKRRQKYINQARQQ